MITVIAIDENDQEIKLSVKSVALVESEEFTCLDIKSAEQLAVLLESHNREDLANKVRKLAAHSILN